MMEDAPGEGWPVGMQIPWARIAGGGALSCGTGRENALVDPSPSGATGDVCRCCDTLNAVGGRRYPIEKRRS